MEDFIKQNIGWLGLGTLGLSSIFMMGWNKFKEFITTLRRFLIRDYRLVDYYTIHRVYNYLSHNYKSIKFGRIEVRSSFYCVGDDPSREIIYENKRMYTIFYKYPRIIFFSFEDNTLTTFKIGFSIKDLVLKANEFYKSTIKDNGSFFFRYVRGNYSYQNKSSEKKGKDSSERTPIAIDETSDNEFHNLCDLVENFETYNITKKDLENVVDPFNSYYPNKTSLDIIDKLDAWFSFQNWYKERGIPWKISFLIHGKGGTGKTSFIRAVAKKYQIGIYCFDLSSMSNSEFLKEWKRISNEANNRPVIVLFEDFDNVFHGRKNITTDNKSMMQESLTFDMLLQCLSGVVENSGIITFITTNDVSKIDPALGVYDKKSNMSSRPGRLDYVYEFGGMEDEPRRKMIEKILHGLDIDLDKVFKQTKGFTSAQVMKKCEDIGSQLLWEMRNART